MAVHVGGQAACRWCLIGFLVCFASWFGPYHGTFVRAPVSLSLLFLFKFSSSTTLYDQLALGRAIPIRRGGRGVGRSNT